MAYISHAVCNKDGRCSAAFLGGACHVGLLYFSRSIFFLSGGAREHRDIVSVLPICFEQRNSGLEKSYHADTDDQTDHWSKESNDSIASYRCGSSMGPAATPDHGTASDYRQAAENQKNEANVGYPAGQVARKENENEADAAKRELEKD